MTSIFILGSHRTGTKTLAGFFKTHFEDIKSYHQYDTLRWVNVFSNAYLSQKIPPKAFYAFLDFFWIKKIKSHQVKYYVESNGFNYIAANYAKKKLDQVKIIHIVRDPRDFVTSYYNWVQGRGKSNFAGKYVPYWNLSGADLKIYSTQEWDNMSIFERYCWYWQYKNEKIETLYTKDSSNYFFFRFEDLINEATREQNIKQLLNYLDLPFQEKQLSFFNTKRNQSVSSGMKKWREWNQKQAQQLQNICGDLMKKYGYGEEEEWQEKVVTAVKEKGKQLQ